MTLPQIFVVLVVLVPLYLVVRGRLRVDVAALLMTVILAVAQFLGMGILGAPNTPGDVIKAISGLSQPVVVTLFSLFIITRCLDKTGVTRWIARRILAVGGHSEGRLIFLFTTTTALLSLFMNNLAAGALLLPTAMDVARRTGIKPSKLLIPVAYGSLLGGVATYFTTANIIVSDLLTTANPPQAPLNILDFTPTGGLIALAGILFLGLLGRRLLPDRPPHPEQVLVRQTASELEDAYRLNERLWEARIPAGSAIIGQTIQQSGIRRLGIAVVAIWSGQQALFSPDREQVLHADDYLLLVGNEERMNQLIQLGVEVGREDSDEHISTRGVALIEVLLAPRSAAEDRTLKDMEFRKQYGFTGVALLREGRSYRTDVAYMKLKPGDSLLMVGARTGLKRLHNSPDFIVLEPDLSDQPIQKRDAALSTAIILAAIGASLAGVPVYLAMLAAAIVVFLIGLLSIEEAYRSMEWQAIFLIAGMYSVSLAMVNTGLAELVGRQVVALVTPFGPLGLAAGVYLLTALLTQVMGGQVTALVTGPIAISAALHMGTNPQAMAVAAAIGCSASFFTPLAHPVNILMIGPGNYTFGDFFRVGWGLTVVCFVMLLVGMTLFWQL
ncbi:MAG: anion permease [Anaerolineae bacterium]|nr:anion permease [Anaerolineae bacterium]